MIYRIPEEEPIFTFMTAIITDDVEFDDCIEDLGASPPTVFHDDVFMWIQVATVELWLKTLLHDFLY